MKKILLLLFAVLLTKQFSAQVVFGSSGSEWRYQYRGLSAHGEGYRAKIYYRNDSIAGLDTLKVFYFSAFFPQTGGDATHTVALKQKGDTIFMNTANTQNTWQILYNFAATAGQSWKTTVEDASNYGDHMARTATVSVLSTGTVNINNLTLKKLHVIYHYTGGGTDTTDIIERIGCTYYMFNYPNLPNITDWSMLSDFLCYKDYVIGTVEFSSLGCNYDVGIAGHGTIRGISIYPTPATDELTIDLNSQSLLAYRVIITNTLGQAILSAAPTASNNTLKLNISGLGRGVYFLGLYEGDKLTGIQKIIRE